MDRRIRYIQVTVPLRLSWNPFYSTDDTSVSVGDRVKVRIMGQTLNAVVTAVDVVPDIAAEKVLPVLSVEHQLEKVSPQEIRLWSFISSYYMCTMGEVFKSAYPTGKIRSEESAAAAQERLHKKQEKAQEAFDKKVQRLQERIARKEEDLARKHSEAVSLRLMQDKKALESALAVLLEEGVPQVDDVPDSCTGPLTQIDAQGSILSSTAQEILSLGTRPVLLQGESHAREEVYRSLVAATLAKGQSVLVLTPETARSRELEIAVAVSAGDRLLTVRSGDSFSKRHKVTEAVRAGGAHLVIGTRSTVFLPFRELGLVIVDEEQDISYKQESQAPRFNGRDTAIILAGIHGAGTVLGSATPSLESMHNAMTGRYAHKGLPTDSLGQVDVEIIDTSAEKRKRGMVGQISRKLIEAVKETSARGGSSLVITSWNDVSTLVADAAICIPEATVTNMREARSMDVSAYDLVALVQVDTLLGGDDFRTDERALQLFDRFRIRCSGHGRFLIQTSRSDHQVFTGLCSMASSGVSAYGLLLPEREMFAFPPFARIVDLIVKDDNAKRLGLMSGRLAATMSAAMRPDALPGGPVQVMGPLQSAPWRTDSEGRRTVRIILRRDSLLQKRKEYISACLETFIKEMKYPGHIFVDVDPA